MTDAERLRKMATEQMRLATEHQVLGRDKRVQFHRSRALLFRRAADALVLVTGLKREVKP